MAIWGCCFEAGMYADGAHTADCDNGRRIAAYTSQMPPMTAGKVAAALNKTVRFRDGIMPRVQMIEAAIAGGALVTEHEHADPKYTVRLSSPDGRFLALDTATKTGIEYARWRLTFGAC